MTRKIYGIEILDELSGIYEILMKRYTPEFHLPFQDVPKELMQKLLEISGVSPSLQASEIVIKADRKPDKDIYLIDQNVIILLGYQGGSDNLIKCRYLIQEKLKGKLVSPMLYFAEKLFYEGDRDDLQTYIMNEANGFIDIIESNSDAIPDKAFLNKDMIANYCDMLRSDSNSNHNSNVRFLTEFYNKIMYSDEFNLISNAGVADLTYRAFEKFKSLDVDGVDKIVILSSLLSMFSIASEEPCLYNLFKKKKDKSINDQVNNVLGDLRCIRYILYATSYIPDYAAVRFLTNDNALFKTIKGLDITMEVIGQQRIYNFNQIDFDRLIHRNCRNSPLFDSLKTYISSLGN